MAITARARRAASAYSRRAGPWRIGGGTGPHSAHTISPVSRARQQRAQQLLLLEVQEQRPRRVAPRAAPALSATAPAALRAPTRATRTTGELRTEVDLAHAARASRRRDRGSCVSSTASCPRLTSASSRSTLAYSAPPRSLVVWIETIRPRLTPPSYYPADASGADLGVPDRAGRAGAHRRRA